MLDALGSQFVLQSLVLVRETGDLQFELLSDLLDLKPFLDL